MKAMLLSLLLGLTCFSTYAKELNAVLQGSTPQNRGVCRIPYYLFPAINLECIRGKRENGVVLYAILLGGEVIRVYEQVGLGEPTIVWEKEWTDV